jgi:RNA polymerase sigma factor (sigma-70 family)
MGQLGRIAIRDSQPFGRERVQDGVDVGAGGDRNLAVDKFRAVGEQTMTAEAPSATVRPDPARSPAPGAYPSKQRRRDGHTRRGPRAPTRTCAGPVRDDPLVIDLVTRARSGDKQAWDALVERYAPLIWSICRSHRLGVADAEDVGQRVWLYLVDQLDRIRDPAALPGWLASATRRECLRVLGAAREPLAAGYALDAETIPDEQTGTAEHELLAAERDAALREALRDLPPCGQRLILLLIEDPPVPYAEISARLGIPVGSIGPTRRRCLDKLRDHPAIAALSDAGSAAGDRGSAAAAGTVGPNAR